jgi:hypothetical protein
MSRRWLIVLSAMLAGCGGAKPPGPATPVATVPASLAALERIDLEPVEPIVVRQPPEISDDVVAKLRVYREIADVPFAAFLAGLAIPEHPSRPVLPETSQELDDGERTVCEITIRWGNSKSCRSGRHSTSRPTRGMFWFRFKASSCSSTP